MKSKSTNTEIQTRKDTIMQKFIVEAEAPKTDQVASSGGIRAKDGSLISQYKNPKPFIETPSSNHNTMSIKDELKYQMGNILLDVAYDLWVDFARPVISAKLNKLGQQLISYIEQPKTTPTRHNDIINVEANIIEPLQDSDNVIQFPSKRAL